MGDGLRTVEPYERATFKTFQLLREQWPLSFDCMSGTCSCVVNSFSCNGLRMREEHQTRRFIG
jgi:hypothetical protein